MDSTSTTNKDITKNSMMENIFTLEWLIVELIVSTLAYKLIILDIVRPFCYKLFLTFDCFDDVKLRSGTLLKNMADEVPILFAVGAHHVIGFVSLIFLTLFFF